MNTRKYPRTLNEAFGPYAHQCPIEEPERPMDWQDIVAIVASFICMLTFIGAILAGLIQL